MFKVFNKHTRTTSLTSFQNFEHILHLYSVSIVNFEHVNAWWGLCAYGCILIPGVVIMESVRSFDQCGYM